MRLKCFFHGHIWIFLGSKSFLDYYLCGVCGKKKVERDLLRICKENS